MNTLDLLSITKEDKVKGIWIDGIKGEGEYKKWYPDGVTLCKHCFYKNGELHGEYKLYRENGQLWKHCFHKSGVRHGEYKRWHFNGQLWLHYLYENGEIVKDYLK